MGVDVYITFNGNCREAVEFYAQVFGTGRPRIMSFGEAPQNPAFPLPEAARNLVMHATLEIRGGTVMFSDTFPGSPFALGNNMSLVIQSKDSAEIKELFGKLKEGGSVRMELQETFFSKCYGALTDRFGIPWQLSVESEAGA